ncbi:hypothetical protein BLNAU_8728 [Blattamonas nauphoetae]|uniref:Uncharacterized protein n=1 Tax=Blattamonas nauphoetae TaxID=2049346 RepID=A0ABQ9XY21_9EUKA|nr:hypothetical protein BLNAU_8728 [Blattamonas nauphoetae]
MLYFFALLSASNFQTPNDLGEPPSQIFSEKINFHANTATLHISYAMKGQIVKGNKLIFTFTPETDTNDGDVVVKCTVPDLSTKDFDSIDVPLTNIGEPGHFQWDVPYTLSKYQNDQIEHVNVPKGFTIATPPPLAVKCVGNDFVSYNLSVSIEAAQAETVDTSVHFKDEVTGSERTCVFTIPAGETSSDLHFKT